MLDGLHFSNSAIKCLLARPERLAVTAVSVA